MKTLTYSQIISSIRREFNCSLEETKNLYKPNKGGQTEYWVENFIDKK